MSGELSFSTNGSDKSLSFFFFVWSGDCITSELILCDDKIQCWLFSVRMCFFCWFIWTNLCSKQFLMFESFGLRENVLDCGEHERSNLLVPFAAQKANFEVFPDILWVMAFSIISAYFNFRYTPLEENEKRFYGNLFEMLIKFDAGEVCCAAHSAMC